MNNNIPIYRQPIPHVAVPSATHSNTLPEFSLSEKTLNRSKALATFISAALLIALLVWM